MVTAGTTIPHARSASIWQAVVRTDADIATAVLRVVLGAVMLPHGLQKTIGWFGGYGFSGTMGWFAQIGVPAPVALLAILAESVGAVLLVAGALGRVAGLGIAAVMAGAIVTVHAPNGFFMNWFGNLAGEGYEYHLLALAMGLSIAIRGSGALSVDRALTGSR
jgi:putative oxidoreductase